MNQFSKKNLNQLSYLTEVYSYYRDVMFDCQLSCQVQEQKRASAKKRNATSVSSLKELLTCMSILTQLSLEKVIPTMKVMFSW